MTIIYSCSILLNVKGLGLLKTKGKPMRENLIEAKLSLTKWINETAEERMTDIQVDDETGKTYKFDWDESFEHTTEDAYQDIMDWVKDYELNYDEMKYLEDWIKGLRSDTFQKELDKLERANKEERLWEAKLGLV